MNKYTKKNIKNLLSKYRENQGKLQDAKPRAVTPEHSKQLKIILNLQKQTGTMIQRLEQEQRKTRSIFNFMYWFGFSNKRTFSIPDLEQNMKEINNKLYKIINKTTKMKK